MLRNHFGEPDAGAENLMPSTKRDLLLDAIRTSPGPLSATEVWDRMRHSGTRIGIATVYRILKSEAEAGRLEPTEFPGAQTRYGLAGRGHHHHFLCTSCDRAFDAPGCADGGQDIAPPQFQVTGHAIMLFGHCHECLATP